MEQIKAGDRAEKVQGRTYCRGVILAVYDVGDEQWCVILIDESEASGHLQHLYPLHMFKKIDNSN